MKTVLKLLSVLAMVAGAIYVIATYGDKIVEWAQKVLAMISDDDEEDAIFVHEVAPVQEPAPEEAPEAAPVEVPAEEPAEAPAEEAPAEEPAEAPAEETPAAPVAEEADFEG